MSIVQSHIESNAFDIARNQRKTSDLRGMLANLADCVVIITWTTSRFLHRLVDKATGFFGTRWNKTRWSEGLARLATGTTSGAGWYASLAAAA